MNINHASCGHATTPAARRVCRSNRNGMLKDAQARYMEHEAGLGEAGDYYATVETLAFHFGISLDEAYELVENGPAV